jgi:AmmeMemoRadiSam system protein A
MACSTTRGYNGMPIRELSREQGKKLVVLAGTVIGFYLDGREKRPARPVDPVFSEKMATFVTLKLSGKLRGCIGRLEPVTTLWEDVSENAINAAFHDFRFSPLNREEFKKIMVEVSVLSSPVLVDYGDPMDLVKKLRPGIDGVILTDGGKRATFLPQVWEQLSSPEQFLEQLCRKAGTDPLAFQKKVLEIKTYSVQSFT